MTDPARAVEYRTVGADDLDAVRPLWEKLRAYHAPLLGDQPPFLFEPRKQGIMAKAAGGRLRVELANAAWHPGDIAYCISTISADGTGEVDSLYVDEAFRSRGIGTELIRRALEWFDAVGTSTRVVNVAYANPRAMALYARFGFAPRTVLLQQR